MRHLPPAQHPHELLGITGLWRERSQGGFPAPSPLLMENLQPGSTTGSVIRVGMLNQQLALKGWSWEGSGTDGGPPGGIRGALG